MCGIVGIYQKNQVDKKVLEKMTDVLMHRGPDGRGVFIDNNIGLGHRRLAIIDLSSAGHQPMVSQNGRYVISYNGEVYNFQKLRKILEKKHYKFNSYSDAEIVLAAYEEWGERALDKFNGMWAFIIYDKKTKRLFASRDRLGIKPLYYYYNQGKLILSSEIKAILEYGIKVQVDQAALNEYFTFQNIFSDRTLFSGIKLLPAASNLEYDGRNLVIRKWWDIPLEKQKLTEREWQEKILDTFNQAMRRHLIADVEIGSYLSGGMDSATITVLASAYNPNIKTFTCGFDLTTARGMEQTFDERKSAEAIARLYSAEHYEMVMQSGSMQRIFPKLIWHLEDLRMGMCYPNYYISNLTSKFVKVVLSGAGGDELFGGYPWRYKIVKNAKKIDEFDKIYYDYWSRLIKDNEKSEFFDKIFQKNIDFNEPYKQYKKIISGVNNLDPVEKALYFDLKTFLHGLFVVEDKVSMASSLEVRVPFADVDIIKLTCALPYKFKFSGQTGKILLRKAMKKILPKNIAEKKKQGFSPPESSWYQDESLPYIKEILSPKSLSRGYFQPEFIRKIIYEHTHGKANHRLLIWSLLSFEWWCRIFLEGDR